ncbi:histidine kinase [Vibrio sp. vnigr-6D03]|uniref:exopolysaccharide Pel transporter PelG n=1 Tax=Vibrio sp. vnigr-6D03 TaxID=2058088 RepID=UPI000C33DC9B|nr:exopolysaccharide Pel transporter PelG [Vibrio sp. vnigr-6D03]PKF76793.1 histidine kinase [Vibrio sp. vnigr-6D03]
MAGIGFEIKKILKRDSLLSIFEAYGLAGMVSSGPWIMSILALLTIGIISASVVSPAIVIVQFLVIVTYMMACSLIISGLIQLLITRFISDLIYAKEERHIIPNLFGAMTIVSILGGGICSIALFLSPELPALVKVTIFVTTVLLCNQWLVIIFLSGMKEYYRIFTVIAVSYCSMVLANYIIEPNGLFGLLFIFCLGQALLTFTFLFYVIRHYPPTHIVAFDFLNPRKAFYSLIFCGAFYYLGVWLDKFVFWAREETSHQVIAIFRASYIYDLPIFIAYLAIMPGMAVFILRMETDFAAACLKFYDAVREGETLETIVHLKNNIVVACRQSIYEIFKVQGITLALLIVWAEDILNILGIDLAYLHLLYVDLVGVSFQVLVMAILNVMFYLDKRYSALILSFIMAVLNFSFAHISIDYGPIYYGYGFVISMVLTSVVGFLMLNKHFSNLVYHTFMLQRT